jgi:hypothetical protein
MVVTSSSSRIRGLIMSKCSGCDQHNAVIYDDEDMYCHDCYNEKLEIEVEEIEQ